MTAIMPPSQTMFQDGVGHRRQASQTRSQISTKNANTSRQRRLQIKGHEALGASKPRFNENVDEEVKSIRHEVANAAQKLKMSALNPRNGSLRDRVGSLSQTTAGQSIRSSLSYIQSIHSVPKVIDRLSTKSGVSASRFADKDRQKKAALMRMAIPAANEATVANIEKEQEDGKEPVEGENVPDNEDADPEEGAEESFAEEAGGMDNIDQVAPVVKLDADNQSVVTYLTLQSSFNHCPSTIDSVASSKLEMQLNFLAKQLELERQRREKLQNEVTSMAQKLQKIQYEGVDEVYKNEVQRTQREKNVKRPNMDVEDLKVLNHGFVSIQ